jgi:hypothetical protein
MRRRRRGDRRGEEPSPRVRVGRFGAARMSAVVTPLVLRDAIAEALWAHVRAQDLAEVCV